MHSAVEMMLKKYQLRTIDDKKNAIKEIVQEIALLGLYRSGFYNQAVFYGGTCLRIFYNLDRFSEDLDFSLIEPNLDFDINKYTKYVQDELASFGFEMIVEEKIKSANSNIKSAFIKGGTQIHLLKIQPTNEILKGVHSNEQIKIKLEIDINPPAKANFETKYHLNPVPFSVKLYSFDSLFARKIHAILCRKWGSRVKGRDFYDFVWYLSQNPELNLEHLEARMKQSNHLDESVSLDKDKLLQLLVSRFEEVDFEQAKQDVLPFISDPRTLELWSSDFFKAITFDKLR